MLSTVARIRQPIAQLFAPRSVFRFSSTDSATPATAAADVSRTLAPVFSLDNASRKGVLSHNIKLANEKYRTHLTDTGSPQVQIAILTERIRSLAVHFAAHKKDQQGYRGFVGLVNNRKRLMRYLRRRDPQQYVTTVKELRLTREAELLKSGKGDKHGQKYFKNI